MQSPLRLTRVAFPPLPPRRVVQEEENECNTEPPPPSVHRPTRPQCALILRAIQGWGDPEQLTDAEAVRLRELCRLWFDIPSTEVLQARVWKDALVFSTRERPNKEYAIIVMQHPPSHEEHPFILYSTDRGHRLVPSEHSTLQYLDHLIGLAMEV